MANPSGALTGLPAVYGADIFDSGTAQKFQLGALGFGYGGNKAFRYGRNNASTASVAGNLQVAATVVPNHVNQLVDVAAAINAMSVEVNVGGTAAAKDLYAEGEFVINDATGEGISYRVAGNNSIASSGIGTIFLEEPIQIALVADTSEFSLVKNPWDRFVISVTDQGDQAVGVSNIIHAVDNYGWLQTRGMCSVLADEAFAVGVAVVCGSSVAGSLEAQDTDETFAQVGIANQVAVDTEHMLVYLTID